MRQQNEHKDCIVNVTLHRFTLAMPLAGYILCPSFLLNAVDGLFVRLNRLYPYTATEQDRVSLGEHGSLDSGFAFSLPWI